VELFGRVYSSSDFQPISEPFLISEYVNQTTNTHEDVAIIGVNDTFIVTWRASPENDSYPSGCNDALHARLYAIDKSDVYSLGETIRVNDDIGDGCQGSVSLSYFPDTRYFVVAWAEDETNDVYARTFRIRNDGIYPHGDPVLVSQNYAYVNQSFVPSVAATSYNTAIVTYIKDVNSSFGVHAARLVRDYSIDDPIPDSASVLDSFFF